jgi:hypothetical protein
MGSGRFLIGDDLEALLSTARIRREALAEEGLQFVRRRHDDGTTYFITNWNERGVDAWVPLAVDAESAVVFDPVSGQRGVADFRSTEAGGNEAYVHLAPGASWILRTYETEQAGPGFPYIRTTGAPEKLGGLWSIRFGPGGPEPPPEVETDQLRSWTELGGAPAEAFSGTATYTLSFPSPGGREGRWLLDLGEVHESARVRLNGTELGTLLGPTYQVAIEEGVLQETNVLEVEVTNLMANRIAALDRQEVRWKKFYNINFPARLPENRNDRGLFDASAWPPAPSGLLGPVILTPLAPLQP